MIDAEPIALPELSDLDRLIIASDGYPRNAHDLREKIYTHFGEHFDELCRCRTDNPGRSTLWVKVDVDATPARGIELRSIVSVQPHEGTALSAAERACIEAVLRRAVPAVTGGGASGRAPMAFRGDVGIWLSSYMRQGATDPPSEQQSDLRAPGP